MFKKSLDSDINLSCRCVSLQVFDVLSFSELRDEIRLIFCTPLNKHLELLKIHVNELHDTRNCGVVLAHPPEKV